MLLIYENEPNRDYYIEMCKKLGQEYKLMPFLETTTAPKSSCCGQPLIEKEDGNGWEGCSACDA